FLFEMRSAQAELCKLACPPYQTVQQERNHRYEEVRSLVAARLKQHDLVRLKARLNEVSADFQDIERLAREGLKSSTTLLSKLKQVADKLNDAQMLATRQGIDDPAYQKLLQ